MAVFVPFVMPGERIDAEIRQDKPGFARGTVTSLIEASPDRVEAACPYFHRCGGCQYQHISYETQLQCKASILRETLQRIARVELPVELKLHRSPPLGYRNRTRLRVRTAPEFALGYYRFGSHELMPVKECPISSPLISTTMAQLIEIQGARCPSTVEEIELFADAGDQRLLVWAFSHRGADRPQLPRWAEGLIQQVPAISGITFFSARHRSEGDAPGGLKPIARVGAAELFYETGRARYRVSAGAFFQVNRHLVDDLVSTVTGNAGGELALDLYAGVGLFSIPLARIFDHTFAVEASPISHANLVQNAPANVKAVRAQSEDYLQRRPSRERPDLVILDPPRAGLGKTVTRSLVELGAPRIRYVSCDPATLGRDLAPLLAAGYRIEEAHLFDLFPQTFHIETVILLAR